MIMGLDIIYGQNEAYHQVSVTKGWAAVFNTRANQFSACDWQRDLGPALWLAKKSSLKAQIPTVDESTDNRVL